MWKQIQKTNYEVNEKGLIRNSTTRQNLKHQASFNGYAGVTLYFGSRSRRKKFLVHRLVAEAFIDNPENKPEVNHKNGNKWDNRSANLEWVTRQENIAHAVAYGLSLKSGKSGEDNNNSKLTWAEVRTIRSLRGDKSYSQIAESFGVRTRAICAIMNNETWVERGEE